MNSYRNPLTALAALLMLTMACTTLTGLFGGGSGTAPGEVPSAPEAAVEAGPTEVQRRELAPTPTPFHTTSEDDVRNALDLGAPDYVDYFDDPEAWFDYDTAGKAAYRFDGGRLIGVDYEPEEQFAWWTYSSRPAGNTYAEVSATNGDCIAKDAVGLVIRVDEAQAAGGYALEVSCDGHWRYVRHRIGKQAEIVIDWTPAESIRTGAGATNRLAIWGYQRELIFFVNGVWVGESTDSNYSYKQGLFAVYVRAHQTYNLTASFDDFAFWHIPFQSQ